MPDNGAEAADASQVFDLPLRGSADSDDDGPYLSLEYAPSVDPSLLPTAEQFCCWVAQVLNAEQRWGDIAIRIVDQDESQAYNQQYRSKAQPTNVLSFPAEVPPGLPAEASAEVGFGDLVLCQAVLLSEAEDQNKSVQDHCAHLVIHGVLHLLGYDHIDEAEAKVMEARERDLLQQLGIDDPYRVA